jgi:hypothetical protein
VPVIYGAVRDLANHAETPGFHCATLNAKALSRLPGQHVQMGVLKATGRDY